MTKFDEFKQNLEAMHDKLEPILKEGTDKFIQIAANYIEQNQKLLSGDRPSLYSSIIRAAQEGLNIDGQESALVPFKGKITFMPMYRGLLKQVRNSGELACLNCGVVYEDDIFEFSVDENGEHLKHVPNFKGKKDKPTVTYCIARIKDGQAPYIEIMRESEIEDCKKSSKAGSDSPWNGKFSNEMRKKTVIRRIKKRLPSSTDFGSLGSLLNADDEIFTPEIEPEVIKDKPPTSSKLADAVKPEAEKVEPPKKFGKEGIIKEVKIIEVKKDGDLTNRYACNIDDIWFGTFNEELYNQMKVDTRATIVFEEKSNPSGKKYKEAIEVSVSKLTDEEVPI